MSVKVKVSNLLNPSFSILHQSIPDLLSLYGSYQIHDTNKDEKEWTGETKECNKLSSVKFLHWPAQTLSDQIHTWHHYQRKEKCEYQPENDRPA